MECQNKTAIQGDKESGTKLFIATDNAFTAVDCVTEITPPDGRLETDLSVSDVGPLSLSSSTLTVCYVPGDAIDVALEAALKDGLDKSTATDSNPFNNK